MKIERIDPFNQVNGVKEIVGVYRESFGGEPWREGYVCPVCQQKYPLNYRGRICEKCCMCDKTILLTEHWPFDTVLTNFYDDMKKADALCFVSRKDDNVTGFAWGFQIEINDELEKEIDAIGLGEIVRGEYFYLAECAVLPDGQNKGMGRKILEKLFKTQKNDRILLRTLRDSVMQKLIEKMGGKVIQNITQDRVIMII